MLFCLIKRQKHMLNPSNMNFEDLSFENAISASQFETIKNIEQLLIGNNSPSSEGTSASFIDSSTVEPPTFESFIECGEIMQSNHASNVFLLFLFNFPLQMIQITLDVL